MLKESMGMQYVSLEKIVDTMKLQNVTPNVPIAGRRVTQVELNRPALQLTGYFKHFMADRIQIIGKVEYTYIRQLDKETRTRVFEELVSYDLPCIIFCRGYHPYKDMIKAAEAHGVPIFVTDEATSNFMASLVTELSEGLAPMISLHGVLVDLYGEGVLIMGESGIGKSEAALELIRRGHRLVADDVVEIRKIDEHTLSGTAPDVTRYFLEVRGIGIIDCKNLFGVESIKSKQNIDMVIRLEEWNKSTDFDRLGAEENYMEILGNNVVCQTLPIRPGRNLAVILEAAAVNHRQKKMGYNAAQELYRRAEENMKRRMKEAEEDRAFLEAHEKQGHRTKKS